VRVVAAFLSFFYTHCFVFWRPVRSQYPAFFLAQRLGSSLRISQSCVVLRLWIPFAPSRLHSELCSEEQNQFAAHHFQSTKEMRRLRGVIFDVDGTLTRPVYDFKILRKRLQDAVEGRFTLGSDVLHELDLLSPPSRQVAENVIHTFEEEGRELFAWNSGALELLQFLYQKTTVRTAVVTRNSDVTLRMLAENLAKFGIIVCDFLKYLFLTHNGIKTRFAWFRFVAVSLLYSYQARSSACIVYCSEVGCRTRRTVVCW
jgi:hypothetical protein